MGDSIADAVAIRDLVFDYGRNSDEFQLVVDELSIESGVSAACIGPSGSGKSTLLSLMCGILLPKTGSVRAVDVDWAQLSDRERRRYRIARVGLVFQEFELLEHMSVRENILLPFFVNPALELTGAVCMHADELAEQAGIADQLRKGPGHLSQGQRQRVALCRALVARPELILADEPTGNLDPESTARVVEMLLGESAERGATLVVVTHDHSVLQRFDRVVDFANFAPQKRVASEGST